MSLRRTRQVTGILFILGALLVNIPYTLLIMNFDYPDILRQPAGEILSRFAEGGSALILTWLAFAWVGLPLLVAILLLPEALGDGSPLGRIALAFGAAGALAQMLGLLRWPFVVPALARSYTSPQATDAGKQAAAAVFQAVHQYGGVVIGEHIGQVFTIVWMVLVCLAILRSRVLPRWLAWMGFAAALVYALAQGELLATSMPGFPTWDLAGPLGSLLWLAWLIVLGILLLRLKETSIEQSRAHPDYSPIAVQ